MSKTIISMKNFVATMIVTTAISILLAIISLIWTYWCCPDVPGTRGDNLRTYQNDLRRYGNVSEQTEM